MKRILIKVAIFASTAYLVLSIILGKPAPVSAVASLTFIYIIISSLIEMLREIPRKK